MRIRRFLILHRVKVKVKMSVQFCNDKHVICNFKQALVDEDIAKVEKILECSENPKRLVNIKYKLPFNVPAVCPPTSSHMTPLCFTVARRQHELIDILLRRGAEKEEISIISSHQSSGYFKLSPFSLACLMEDLSIVQLLLDAGCNADQSVGGFRLTEEEGGSTDYDGYRTALFFAVAKKNSSLVEVLLEAGASVSITDHNGDTPSHMACRLDHLHVPCFASFVRHGAISSRHNNRRFCALGELWRSSRESLLLSENCFDVVHKHVRSVCYLLAGGYDLRRTCNPFSKYLGLYFAFIEEMWQKYEYMKTFRPWSLKNRCRATIRRCMFLGKICRKPSDLKELDLPNELKMYLNLEIL